MRELTQAIENITKFIDRLNDLQFEAKFDPSNQADIERVKSEIRASVTSALSEFDNSKELRDIADSFISEAEKQILATAEIATSETVTGSMENKQISKTLTKAVRAINTLRQCDWDNAAAHLHKLKILFNSPELIQFSKPLKSAVYLDQWIKEAEARGGSFVGSSRLDWKISDDERFGYILCLIDVWGDTPDRLLDFCLNHAYVDNNFTRNLNGLAGNILAPFVQDFSEWIEDQTKAEESSVAGSDTNTGNGKIFISHAAGDKDYAEAVEGFLVEFCGIPRARFFRSSGNYNGIKSGKNFRDFMEKEIKECSLVLSLVTPLFCERPFCQMEVGGVWLLQKPCIPIITDSSLHSYVGSVFGEIQAHPIKNEKKYFGLREAIEEHVETTPPGHDESAEIGRKFGRRMKKVERLLGDRNFASKSELDALKVKLAAFEKDRDAAESQLSELQEKYDILYRTKTASEARLLEPPQHTDFKEHLDELINNIKSNKPPKMIGAVCVDIGLAHAGGSSDIDYEGYKEGFEAAYSHGYLDREDGTYCPSNRHLRDWLLEVDALISFLDRQDSIEELEERYDLDLRPDLKPFWTETLDFKGVDMSR